MNPRKTPSPALTETARKLRRQMTQPERLLWFRLRGGRLAGLKFRRQQPIEPYVVDFYCHERRLVVEVDGLSHAGAREDDVRRQAFLERQGLQVMRFTNDQVLHDLDGVVEAIKAMTDTVASSDAPSPGPSRRGGGSLRQPKQDSED